MGIFAGLWTPFQDWVSEDTIKIMKPFGSSSQFGAGMWYWREDKRLDGERLFVSTQLKDVYVYPKVFDWNGDGALDLITLKQGSHLWKNIGGTPIPDFQYAGRLNIEEESGRQLPDLNYSN